MTASHRHWIATGLAHALLADSLQPQGRTRDALMARAAECLGQQPAWLLPLVQAVAREFERHWARHTVPTLADWIDGRSEFDLGSGRDDDDLDDAEGEPDDLHETEPTRVRSWILRPARMVQRPFALERLDLPRWDTVADLAAWLDLPLERLNWWLAPARHFRDPTPDRPQRIASAHYHCLLRPKRTGGLRLIEVPQAELKAVQRKLLAGLLDKVPAHECAHGFVAGRSVVTHAREHAGAETVLTFDLKDFFHTVGIGRVRALCRTLGYAEGVTDALSRLFTTSTPRGVRDRLQEAGAVDLLGAARLGTPHLPQGAPTSPALANLCAFRLDLRLEGLAWRFGARYSRYADDLVFSGGHDLLRHRRELRAWLGAIVRDEGFVLHPRKQRAMPRHGRQCVTGIVVNEKPNLARDTYDRLRARLHGLGRTGCDAQALLRVQGEVAWAAQLVTPERADKLRRLLAAIPAYDGGAPPASGHR